MEARRWSIDAAIDQRPSLIGAEPCAHFALRPCSCSMQFPINVAVPCGHIPGLARLYRASAASKAAARPRRQIMITAPLRPEISVGTARNDFGLLVCTIGSVPR